MTARVRVSDSGCVFLKGDESNLELGFKINVSDLESFLNKGYQACEGQYGTTNIPSALSVNIFFKNSCN